MRTNLADYIIRLDRDDQSSEIFFGGNNVGSYNGRNIILNLSHLCELAHCFTPPIKPARPDFETELKSAHEAIAELLAAADVQKLSPEATRRIVLLLKAQMTRGV